MELSIKYIELVKVKQFYYTITYPSELELKFNLVKIIRIYVFFKIIKFIEFKVNYYFFVDLKLLELMFKEIKIARTYVQRDQNYKIYRI